MSVNMTYTGASGDVNYEVAQETGGPALMEQGKTYEVSEELAGRLVLGGWQAPQGREEELRPGPDATDGARRKAQELGVDLESVEGTGVDGRITVTDVEKHTSEQEAG